MIRSSRDCLVVNGLLASPDGGHKMTRLWLILEVILPMAQLRARSGKSNKTVANKTANPIASGLLRKKKGFRWATRSRLRVEIEVRRLQRAYLCLCSSRNTVQHMSRRWLHLRTGDRLPCLDNAREGTWKAPSKRPLDPGLRTEFSARAQMGWRRMGVGECPMLHAGANCIQPTCLFSRFTRIRTKEAFTPQPLSRRRSYSPQPGR